MPLISLNVSCVGTADPACKVKHHNVQYTLNNLVCMTCTPTRVGVIGLMIPQNTNTMRNPQDQFVY